MFNFKKAILLILAGAFILMCTACSSSDSSYDSYNDYNSSFENNYDDSTDYTEEVNYPEAITPGVYTFFNAAAGGYLSYSENTMYISDTPSLWQVENSGFGGVFIYALGTKLMFDIDNAYISSGNEIKLWNRTSYDTQIWEIVGNKNSTYSVISAADNGYCLSVDGVNTVLQTVDEYDTMQQWILQEAEYEKGYLSYFSAGEIIELRMPLDITDVISAERLQQWADDLETAYYSFYDLTGYIPYDAIIVEAYIDFEDTQYAGKGYAGFVMDYSNIIRVDSAFLYGDLEKMAVRKNDWNFCVLHEMGHMFDMRRPWKFEAEAMTDIKIAYVLEINGAGAAPAQFDTSTVFYGADIINAYENQASDFSNTYDVFGCAHRFLQIKEDIGWEPFIQTFHYMQENYDAYSSLSDAEKFINFVSLLSYYSGTEVSVYFSEGEWNAVINACD